MQKIDRYVLPTLFMGAVLLIAGCLSNPNTGQVVDKATRLNQEVAQLYNQGRYQEATPLAKQALAINEKASGPDHPSVAASLGNLALVYRNLGDYAKAEPLFKRSLSINEKAFGPDHPSVAISLGNLGVLYNDMGDYAKAEPLFKRSLSINEKALGLDHLSVAISLGNLGLLYVELGDYAKAEPLSKRSLSIYEKALGPDHPSIAISLGNLGVLYLKLGDYAKAEPLFKRSLSTYEKALGPDHENVAISLNNLAKLYQTLGDYAKVEPLYKRSLAINEKALGTDHPSVALSLNNLAFLYYFLGDYGRTESLLKRSLSIYEKALGTDHPSVALSLNNLAKLYQTLGDYARVEPLYKRSLAINEKALGTDHPDVATILENLGSLYLADGRIGKAFNIFKKQDTPSGLGTCYLAQGNYSKAEKEFQRSLRRTQKSGRKNFIPGHIGLGFSYEGMRDFVRAKAHFNEAIDLIEAQWQTLGLSARKTFLAGEVGWNFSRLDAYEGMVRVIMKKKKKGYQKEALLYAERVKSRTLLEMLAAKGARGVGKKSQEVLARDRRFQQKITILRKRVSILTGLGTKAPDGEKERVEQGLNKTLQDYERFINEVKLKDTELASLITVEATPVEKIQFLLDSSITVLEYFTTKDKTYAWLITRDHVSVHELNLGEKTLLAMVNELLLPNISNRSRRPEPLITLSTGKPQAGETGRQEREKNRQRFLKATKDFYRSILGPLDDGIRTDRLIVVPHGALHKVPFAALNDGKRYLVDKYALSVVPSSTVLDYVVKKRNRNLGRFLAFSNPKTDYVPLGFAEIEVSSISDLFFKKEIYSRGKATEGRAKGRTSSPDVIHFACHGEFNDKQPMQSGLLLTKDADNDGYLQVHEIFGLDLRNANLVVLSACETALSKIYGGDDLVGLSRGFIYAGTPSLLATLWEVEDHSTAILIEEFYKNWQKKGMSKPKALQQAQVALKSMPQYQHPFYWAPFIMIGDWRLNGKLKRIAGIVS